MLIGAPRRSAARGPSGAQMVQHRQDAARRGAAGLAEVDLRVGDDPCPIEDEAGRDRQSPTLLAVEEWQVDAVLTVDAAEELRNAPAHPEQLSKASASV